MRIGVGDAWERSGTPGLLYGEGMRRGMRRAVALQRHCST